MIEGLLVSIFVFVLAVLLGFEVISKVSPTLHTPLMSGSNAISGIVLIGALVVVFRSDSTLGAAIGLAAVTLATINVVGGFMVTDRMYENFCVSKDEARFQHRLKSLGVHTLWTLWRVRPARSKASTLFPPVMLV